MTISVVQSKLATGANSVTFTSNTTAGNALFVVYCGDKGNQTNGIVTTISGVTIGGAADNFVSQVDFHDTVGTHSGAIAAVWMDTNCTGGQTAIAVSGSNIVTATGYTMAWEVSGMGSAPTLDQHTGIDSFAGAATWTSGTTGTTTAGAEFCIGATAHGPNINAETIADTTPGNPWTDSASFTSTAPGLMAICGSRITSSTTTLVYSGTSSASDFYEALVCSFAPGGTFGGSGIPAGPSQANPGSAWRNQFGRAWGA